MRDNSIVFINPLMNRRKMINSSFVLKSISTSLAILFLLGISYNTNSTEGSQIQQSKLQNKWMIVNFWAQWCSPCREEIPEFNRLTTMLDPNEIEVFGINYDGIEGAELESALKTLDIRFPQMNAQQQALINFKMPAALPATYIVAPTGEVKVSLIGKQNLENILKAMENVNPQFEASDFINYEQMVTP